MSGTPAGRSLAGIGEVLAAARIATANAGSALLGEAIGPGRLRAGRGAPYAAWGDPALLDAYIRTLAEAMESAASSPRAEGGAE